MTPSRRSDYEITIEPGVRPHKRQRIAVTAVFAPDYATAAQMILGLFNEEP